MRQIDFIDCLLGIDIQARYQTVATVNGQIITCSGIGEDLAVQIITGAGDIDIGIIFRGSGTDVAIDAAIVGKKQSPALKHEIATKTQRYTRIHCQ